MNNIDRFFDSVLVVDTETTGVDAKKAELVEVAGGRLFHGQWHVDELLMGTLRPIPPEASAIHFISNRMVEGLDTFDDKIPEVNKLLQLDTIGYMAAHNANFDRSILAEAYRRCNLHHEFKEFDEERKWICTWRLAKAVLGIDYELMQYGLSYLRFYLDLDIDENIPAHRAVADVTTCGRLLEKLLAVAIEKNLVDPGEEITPQLISLCWDPIPITKWFIGKHKGKLLSDIPTDYFMWALQNLDELNETTSRFNRDLAQSIENLLSERGVI